MEKKFKTKKQIALLFIFIMLFQCFYIQPIRAVEVLPLDDSYEAYLIAEQEIGILAPDNSEEPIYIPANTPISLRLENTISTENCKEGDNVNLRVSYDIHVNGKTVIPAGSIGKSIVSLVEKPKIFGKAGKISLKINSVITPDGKFIAVSGNDFTRNGESRATQAWVWFGVSLLILWPCIFVPFFLKGKQAEISSGTIFDVYTVKKELVED
jgi:hypothetical protein